MRCVSWCFMVVLIDILFIAESTEIVDDCVFEGWGCIKKVVRDGQNLKVGFVVV